MDSTKARFNRNMIHQEKPESIATFLRSRQLENVNQIRKSQKSKGSRIALESCNFSNFANDIPRFVSQRASPLYNETEFEMSGNDKVFASAWLSSSEIVMGTKCNKLLVLNVETGKKIEIPALLIQGEYGLEDDKNDEDTAGSEGEENFQSRKAQLCYGIHSIAVNPSRTLLAVGAGKPTEFIQVYELPTFKPLAVLRGHTDMVFSVCWIDDISLISCSRDITVKIWKIDEKYRRGNIKTVGGQKLMIFTPQISKKEHFAKVRDLKYNAKVEQAGSLSSDGFVKIWDVKTGTNLDSILLKHQQEAVCMTVDYTNNLYAVGSQEHVSLIDPRSSSIVHIFESVDDRWGVRSMSIDRQTVTIGGGMGRISFYDMRAQKYIEWTTINRDKNSSIKKRQILNPQQLRQEEAMDVDKIEESYNILDTIKNPSKKGSKSLANFYFNNKVISPLPFNIRSPVLSLKEGEKAKEKVNFHKNGKGWLQKDADYEAYFLGMEINNAIYTLGYENEGRNSGVCKIDESWGCQAASNRLFVAGGPLQLSLFGSYSAIWNL
ncbi:hypothetical protein HK099_002890 [Clydaea vesicula]|uniref:DDB1- and CUL4-associated factor 12 beta-propeller domain-containing protein n=1 Tax=Clydaea vesicula TaxID=447962 RepID=A0AAD5U8J7_9FUNG|nr:hypothetical protein HK099_002890 [Clydaea vesicula]